MRKLLGATTIVPAQLAVAGRPWRTDLESAAACRCAAAPTGQFI